MTHARSTNTLLQSEHYAVILKEYNELYKATGGKVNAGKFWENQIFPRIPTYPIQTWYGFLRRFRSESVGIGLAPLPVQGQPTAAEVPALELDLKKSILSNKDATDLGISTALNLGAAYYAMLMKKYHETPELLLPFEHKILSDALFKAMKSQDSRIHSIGKIKEDGREEEKMNRAFKGASFE